MKQVEEMSRVELIEEAESRGVKNLRSNISDDTLRAVVKAKREEATNTVENLPDNTSSDNTKIEDMKLVNVHASGRTTFSDVKDTQKSLEDQGFVFLTPEEDAARIEKIKEEFRKEFQQQLREVTCKLERADEDRVEKLQSKCKKIVVPDISVAETYKKIMEQPTTSVFIPRLKNYENTSILKKKLLMNDDGTPRIIGNKQLYTDVARVVVNGALFEFPLGPDDGGQGVLIHNVPWHVACILADKYSQPVSIPQHNLYYTPPKLQTSAQQILMDKLPQRL